MEQKNTTSGSVKISVDVLRTIVRNVLSETEGVHSLVSRTATNSGWKAPMAAPIETTLNAEVAVVNVAVNLCYGYRLKDVAQQIQARVKDTIQDMTGIAVSRVNVLIADIRKKETA